ncbi:unnamed protein product [Calypogeia fissa]
MPLVRDCPGINAFTEILQSYEPIRLIIMRPTGGCGMIEEAQDPVAARAGLHPVLDRSKLITGSFLA